MQREKIPLRRAESQSPHKAPPIPHVFPGWGLGAFQWREHHIYLVSKSEKELFFLESITSQMYRISRISYETLNWSDKLRKLSDEASKHV